MFGVIATPARGGGGGGGTNDNGRRGMDLSMSFGDVESFVEPAPKERQQLQQHLNDKRRPLQARSDLNKGEFTPLLKSAKGGRMRNHLDLMTPGGKSVVDNSGLTPVSFRALRPGARGNDDSSLSLARDRNGDKNDSDMSRGGAIGEVGGIREQEQAMDKMKKENWELKLKIFLMEKQAFQSSPEHVQLALKENIANKVELASLSKEIQKYKRLLADTEAKMSSLGEQVSQSLLHMSAECPLHHGMTDEERQMVEELRDDKAHFEAERDNLQDQLERAQQAADEAEQEKAKLETELEQLRQAFDAKDGDEDARLIKAEQTVANLREEKGEVEDKLREVQDALEDLQLEHEMLENKHDELLSQTRSATDDELVNVLREQLEERAEECGTLQGRVQALERANVALEERIIEREREIEELQARHDEASLKAATLEIELESARRHQGSVQQQINQLEQALADQREEANTLQGQLADRSCEIEQLREKAARDLDRSQLPRDDQVQVLEEQVEILEADKEMLQKRVSELEKQVNDLEEDLDQAVDRDEERDGEVESLKVDLEAAYAKQAELKRELNNVRDELDEERLRQIDQSTVHQQQDDASVANETLPELVAARKISAENSELRGTLEDLEYAIRQKEDEVAELTEKLIQATEGLVSEHGAVVDVRRQLESVRKELDSAKAAVVQREDKARALETSLLNVRGLLADAQAAHKTELQSSAELRENELARQKSEHGAVEVKLRAEIETHSRAVVEVESSKAIVQRNLDATLEQVRSLEATVRRLGEQEETMNLDQAKWRDALQMESDRHATKVASLEGELEELAGARDQLKRELRQRSDDAERASERQRQVEVSLQEKTRACERLEGDLESMRRQQSTNETDKLQLEDTINNLEEELNLLSTDLEQARAETSAKIHELTDCQARNAELDAQIRTLDGRVMAAEQERERLTLSLASADARLVQMTKRIEDATEERVRLEGELESALSAKEAGEIDPKLASTSSQRPSSANDPVAESERARLRSELNAVREQLDVAQTEIAELAAERDLLESQLDQATADLEATRSDSAEAVAKLSEQIRSTSAALQKEQQDRVHVERQFNDDLRDARDARERVERASQDVEASLALSRKTHTDYKSNVESEMSALKRHVVELELELDSAPSADLVEKCDEQMRQLLTLQKERATIAGQLEVALRRADDLRSELSTHRQDSESALQAVERDARGRIDRLSATLRGLEERHRSEVLGMSRMLAFVRLQKDRSQSRCGDLAFIKMFYDRQIASFEACNQANLAIVRRIGISGASAAANVNNDGDGEYTTKIGNSRKRTETTNRRRRTLACVAQAVLATIKMRKLAESVQSERVEKLKLGRAVRDRHR